MFVSNKHQHYWIDQAQFFTLKNRSFWFFYKSTFLKRKTGNNVYIWAPLKQTSYIVKFNLLSRVLTPTYPWDWDTESESELAELKDVEER